MIFAFYVKVHMAKKWAKKQKTKPKLTKKQLPPKERYVMTPAHMYFKVWEKLKMCEMALNILKV